MSKSLLSLLVVTLLMGSMALAQKSELGTISGPFARRGSSSQTLDIFLTASYANASYATGGTALRNSGVGTITVNGVTGSTQAAWLYWAVLLNTSTIPNSVKSMTISRIQPAGVLPKSIKVTGTLIATGGDPCWGSTGARIFRAAVPTSVVTGAGRYQVKANAGASGLITNANPWSGTVFPLMEGASLVVVGTGSSSVGLLDSMAGQLLAGTSLDNYYQLPATVNSQILFDAFFADGQTGGGRNSSATGETTTVDGWSPSTGDSAQVVIAGPGGQDSDSDMDGSSGFPLPQLWDDVGHDVSPFTGAVPAGSTWMHVFYSAPLDCVNLVGAVVSVQ